MARWPFTPPPNAPLEPSRALTGPLRESIFISLCRAILGAFSRMPARAISIERIEG